MKACRGFTLIEMVIVGLIFVLILAPLCALMARAERNARSAMANSAAASRLESALEAVSHVVPPELITTLHETVDLANPPAGFPSFSTHLARFRGVDRFPAQTILSAGGPSPGSIEVIVRWDEDADGIYEHEIASSTLRP